MATFKLKNGREIEICLVSSFKIASVRQAVRAKFIEEHGEPKPPTYTTKLGGGPGIATWEEEHAYTKDNIADGNEKDQADWREYLRLEKLLGQKIWAKTAEIYLLRGVLEDMPDDDSWIKEQAEDGIEVPKSDRERKIHWVKTELLQDSPEMMSLIAAIQGREQEVEQAATVAAGMFQRPMGRPGRDKAE